MMNSVKCKKVQSPFPGLQKQALPVSVSPVLTLYTTIMDKFLNLPGFFNSKCPTPPPPPKQRWKLASSGEGERQAIFEKDALFYDNTQKLQKIMNTALLFQGFLSRIVGKTKRSRYLLHCPRLLHHRPKNTRKTDKQNPV